MSNDDKKDVPQNGESNSERWIPPDRPWLDIQGNGVTDGDKGWEPKPEPKSPPAKEQSK